MIVSKLKPWSEIEKYISGDDTVFVLGCNGCAQSSGTGGAAEVAKMQEQIKSVGKSVSGTSVVDFLCQETLVASRLRPRAKQLESSDAILVMTCGIGVQTVAAVAGMVCHPACDTVYMGGARGEWPAGERCQECGECVLEFTGGICPLSACSKALLSGACGGASNGNCELDKEKPCGWERIYLRLKSLGQLEKLGSSVPPKDHNKRMAYAKAIKTPFWNLENENRGSI
ncbi:MAG: 5,10-methylenetetrahydrofolate reductase [Dehalococcoidia bacterium]|nr:MAG: 5,10-methylenetetrahydrofolate reductase [Dehalococcoidia bacterium]